MELFIFIFSAIILAETTILLIKSGKNFSLNSNPKRKVYVDTSALMDGRILAVAQTGFIGDDLIIPRSVIRELQLLADGKDSEKRTRARAGRRNGPEGRTARARARERPPQASPKHPQQTLMREWGTGGARARQS